MCVAFFSQAQRAWGCITSEHMRMCFAGYMLDTASYVWTRVDLGPAARRWRVFGLASGGSGGRAGELLVFGGPRGAPTAEVLALRLGDGAAAAVRTSGAPPPARADASCTM